MSEFQELAKKINHKDIKKIGNKHIYSMTLNQSGKYSDRFYKQENKSNQPKENIKNTKSKWKLLLTLLMFFGTLVFIVFHLKPYFAPFQEVENTANKVVSVKNASFTEKLAEKDTDNSKEAEKISENDGSKNENVNISNQENLSQTENNIVPVTEKDEGKYQEINNSKLLENSTPISLPANHAIKKPVVKKKRKVKKRKTVKKSGKIIFD